MKKILIIAICIVGVPFLVSAETVLRTGETVSISNDSGVVGDFYGVGNVVTVSGLLEGDFVTIAGRMTLNGEVSQDLTAVGGSVDVHGPVGDDVRVLGGDVVIADVVSGDVVVVGGSVNILTTAVIEGDLFVYGGEVVVDGVVGGTIFGTVSDLRINSEVAGDVTVSVGQLTLGESANVAGSVAYTSGQIVKRSPNAIVSGEVLRNDSTLSSEETRSPLQTWVIFSLMLTFSTLLWFLIKRDSLHAVGLGALRYSPRPVLFGIAVLIVAPIMIAVLLTSMIGSVAGMVLLFAYLLLLLLAIIGTPVVLGLGAFKALNQSTEKLTIAPILFGIFILVLALQLPAIGALIVFAVFVLTFGAIAEVIYKLLAR